MEDVPPVSWQVQKYWKHNVADTPNNQPTKKLTKGGVLCKRKTSSLARFDHSCVRNALLEMVNCAWNYNGGVCLR
jgi:hypothetical protein